MSAVAAGAFEFLFEPTLLGAAGVAAHVGVAAVLIADVVVGQADHPHRSGRERVPQASQLRIRAGVRQREVRLVGAVADRAVAQLVLVVARRRHPRPVARGPGVVLEPVRPRPDAVVGQVGVAQVAVDQVEQRRGAFDRGRDVARRGRSAVVAAERARDQRVQRRGGLVAEAGETQRRRDRAAPCARCPIRDWRRRARRRRRSRCRARDRSAWRGAHGSRVPDAASR